MPDMRSSIQNLRVENAVLHILDKANESLVLSDFPLDLTDEIRNLIKTHIIQSINSDGSRVGEFVGEVNPIKELSYRIFSDLNSFINRSKEIARSLYTSMQTHHTISSANCLISVYSCSGFLNLAILKLDFTTNRYAINERTPDGRIRIKIAESGKGIPDKGQRLQKCVFIHEDIQEGNTDIIPYDMILLDKQSQERQSERSAAKFFVESFLNCRLARNNTDCTRDFKRTTISFIQKVYSNDLEKTLACIETVISRLKALGELDIVLFADVLFDNEEIKEKYKEKISEKVGDFTFEIDRRYVENHIKKRKIQTNKGIKIDVDLAACDDDGEGRTISFIPRQEYNANEVDILIKRVTYKETVS